MDLENKVFAYIDGANLHKGVADLDWEMDYKKFRVWLKNKYNVLSAYLFVGFVPKLKNLYTHLLRKQNIPLLYLDSQKDKLRVVAKKEKTPDADETA